MTDIEKAERILLRAADSKTVSSTNLLTAAERVLPGVSADTVRYAYWTVVNEGKLERTANGVRKKS